MAPFKFEYIKAYIENKKKTGTYILECMTGIKYLNSKTNYCNKIILAVAVCFGVSIE